MDSKIQQLTEAIYNEGTTKAREEAEAILREAGEKAARMEADAAGNAEKIVNEARSKAQEIRTHVESEIRMTVSQAISAMKQELTSLVTLQVIQPPVKELFSDKEFLQNLILTVVKGWLEKESFDLSVILPNTGKEEMEQFFRNNLAAELNKGLNLSFGQNVKSGFKVGPSDGSYQISFTDDDFVNFLKAYLRPKTSQLLFAEGK